MNPGPLDGLTVLEGSSFVAAPLGGLTLAPSGTSLFWTGLNKGKRSVTVNFRRRAGT